MIVAPVISRPTHCRRLDSGSAMNCSPLVQPCYLINQNVGLAPFLLPPLLSSSAVYALSMIAFGYCYSPTMSPQVSNRALPKWQNSYFGSLQFLSVGTGIHVKPTEQEHNRQLRHTPRRSQSGSVVDVLRIPIIRVAVWEIDCAHHQKNRPRPTFAVSYCGAAERFARFPSNPACARHIWT